MINLEKHVGSLEAVRMELKGQMKCLQEKMDAIDSRSIHFDCDMTDEEHERYDELKFEYEDLENECDEIQNAINHLINFCEDC